jgi:fimbrial chaperone protein
MKVIARKIALCLGAAMLLLAQPSALRAGALSVEPLFIELLPGSSGAVRVRNTSDAPITVELSVSARMIDENGKQTRTDAENDFVLFPPQGVIAPQQVQVFRIQPLTPDSEKSRSYFLTVKQLPVKLGAIEGGGTRLQVVFAFDVATHTVPRGAKSDMQFVTAKLDSMEVEKAPATDAPPPAPDAPPAKREFETVPAVAVTLRNDGNKYLYLQDQEYLGTATDAAGKIIELPVWDETAIVDAAKVSLVLPGAIRTFKLPLRNMPELKSVELRVRPRPGAGNR